MCTNIRNLECYMDELLDCLESFVRKSLFVLSLGLGAVVVALYYLLKSVIERNPVGNTSVFPGVTSQYAPHNALTANSIGNKSENPSVKENEREKITLNETSNKSSNTSSNTSLRKPAQKSKNKPAKKCITISINTDPCVVARPSYEETILKEIGLTNCKQCRSCQLFGKKSRVTIPSLSLIEQQVQFPAVGKRTSCCSLCCDKDDYDCKKIN